jgi:hypothetical protein
MTTKAQRAFVLSPPHHTCQLCERPTPCPNNSSPIPEATLIHNPSLTVGIGKRVLKEAMALSERSVTSVSLDSCESRRRIRHSVVSNPSSQRLAMMSRSSAKHLSRKERIYEFTYLPCPVRD